MRELTDDGGTGDAQVDEALRTLDALDQLPVHEHAAVIENVHQALQDRLTGDGAGQAADHYDAYTDTDADDTHTAHGHPDPGAEG